MTTLDEIVAYKRTELEDTKARVPIGELERAVALVSPAMDFENALAGPSISLIAEIKKASPSSGMLRPDLDPVELAYQYTSSGASAISVLTESHFFLGDLNFLREIKSQAKGWEHSVPLLRKDFIVDPYQICEARAYGADALLLIVAILTPQELKSLLALTHQLGMEALVEVHTAEETTAALDSGARVIGINNRDLHTFTTDLEATGKLRPLIPSDRTVVSESGIKSREDVKRLREWGVNAMLIGEAIVTSKDIEAKVREFLDQN
ncbi:MAG: indole-3-glycerol phosphate synthase TrpC [Dehalococcoidia bacterium]|nr:indole-3-glycerol phosphate synthase TrpC [Dehalococcoidia bacterium]